MLSLVAEADKLTVPATSTPGSMTLDDSATVSPTPSVPQQPCPTVTSMASDHLKRIEDEFKDKIAKDVEAYAKWATGMFQTYQSELNTLKDVNNDLLKQVVDLDARAHAWKAELAESRDCAATAEAKVVTLEANGARFRDQQITEAPNRRIIGLQMQLEQKEQCRLKERDSAANLRREMAELRAYRDRMIVAAAGERMSIGRDRARRGMS